MIMDRWSREFGNLRGFSLDFYTSGVTFGVKDSRFNTTMSYMGNATHKDVEYWVLWI